MVGAALPGSGRGSRVSGGGGGPSDSCGAVSRGGM